MICQPVNHVANEHLFTHDKSEQNLPSSQNLRQRDDKTPSSEVSDHERSHKPVSVEHNNRNHEKIKNSEQTSKVSTKADSEKPKKYAEQYNAANTDYYELKCDLEQEGDKDYVSYWKQGSRYVKLKTFANYHTMIINLQSKQQ